MRKRILVTGGFGFIGYHLVERLLKEWHDVYVIDNLSNNAVNPRYRNFKQGNVEDLNTVFRDEHFDEIYHLASPVGPAGVLAYAGEITRQIVNGTYAVMEKAQACSAKLVFVSTSEIYGGGNQGLCSETMPRTIIADTSARLEYAVAKLAAETAIINTATVKDLNAVIIRPFNVAGARQGARGGFVLPRFVRQAIAGEALTVFGTGQQVRAFTHVRDIVEGLLLAMGKGRSGECYNLGNPDNRTTVLGLAEMVVEQLGRGQITFVDPKSIYGPLFAEAADKYPDATKAMTELGWRPVRKLNQIIQSVYLDCVPKAALESI